MLSRKVKEEDAKAFIKNAALLKDPGDRNNVEAVLQVSMAANQELYSEIRRQLGMIDALRDLMKEEIDEIMRNAKIEGLQEGRQAGLQEGRQENLLENIRNLMANMKWTADQAMSAMSIPAEKWGTYKAKL